MVQEGHKILIVDDELPICELLAIWFGKEGYECRTATSGDEALSLLDKNNYSLLVTDINMPGMSGIELQALAVERFKDLAVIMVTAIDDREIAMQALELGVFGYVLKPLMRNEVLINAQNALRLRKLEIENRTHREKLEQLVLKRTQELMQANEQLLESLHEKETLLKEIHHRVKNNMQVVSSILKLQARKIQDKELATIFEESQNRIMAMALIHEKIYRSENLSQINFGDYIKELALRLFSFYNVSKEKIGLKVEAGDVLLDVETAIPCGLIVNELVSNCLKHGFPDKRTGEIQIGFKLAANNILQLTTSDSGVGIPDDIDFRNTESLGLHLVTMLVEDQLDGKITLDRTSGTEFNIRFQRKDNG